MQRKIIIGVNDSPQGADALSLGRALGTSLDAVALVATVLKQPRHSVDQSELDEAVAEFCEPLFATARERLDGLDVVVRPLVAESRPGAIYELADWESPSLIVIGSTHLGPTGRVLLGSFGHALLSGAPCGVAVAPRGYGDGEQRLDRIGVALDGTAESWHALEAAVTLAGRSRAPLQLLSVMEPPHYALGGLLSKLGPDEYRDFKEKEAEGVFDEAAGRIPDDISTEQALLNGDPAEQLAKAAHDLDLLVTGSRGYGPVKRTVLGSVSAKLMSTAPCPVMVLPRGTGSRPLET
jgi:nucleotide-binding universal stress UspA family protein